MSIGLSNPITPFRSWVSFYGDFFLVRVLLCLCQVDRQWSDVLAPMDVHFGGLEVSVSKGSKNEKGTVLGCPRKLIMHMVSKWVISSIYPIYK